jgi:hypothetical protein
MDVLPSLRDLYGVVFSPGVETPGYFQVVPLGQGKGGQIEMRRNTSRWWRFNSAPQARIFVKISNPFQAQSGAHAPAAHRCYASPRILTLTALSYPATTWNFQ